MKAARHRVQRRVCVAALRANYLLWLFTPELSRNTQAKTVMNGDYFFHPSWPIFHRDNHLLVVYKPAGLLVQADETEEICR